MYFLKISLVSILFFGFNLGVAQDSGTITYAVDHLEKYTNTRITKRNLDGSLKRVAELDSVAKAVLSGSKAIYQLDFNKDYAHFYLKDVDDKTADVVKRSFGGIEDHYYDLQTNTYIFRYNLEDHNHLVEQDPYHSIENWHITNETKEIAGYTCTKAILVNEFENLYDTYAWFTEEIPLAYGALEYTSLPGVILGLEHKHRFIYAIDVDLEQAPNIQLPELKTYDLEAHHALLYGNTEPKN